MKVITVFKWSRNPQDARVGMNGSVDWRGVKMAPSDDDPAVMEIAKALAGDGEIIGLTIGDGDIAWAAARGAASTIAVTDAQTEVDSASTAAIIAAAIKRVEDVDAVIIGDSAWNYGVVSALVGQLGWPAVAGVVAASKEDNHLQVTRRIGTTSQVLEIEGPVVLAVMASREEVNAPGMKEILTARKKPVERLTMSDLGLTPVEKASSKGTRFPDTLAAKIIDGSDPVAACKELMAALHTDGVL